MLLLSDENAPWVTFQGHSYLFIYDQALSYEEAQRVNLVYDLKMFRVYCLLESRSFLWSGIFSYEEAQRVNLEYYLKIFLVYCLLESSHRNEIRFFGVFLPISQQQCERYAATLVSVNSREEQTFLESQFVLAKPFSSLNQWWSGARHGDRYEQWIWADGKTTLKYCHLYI